MLAGDVRANFQGDHLFIRGDQFDNQIRIIAREGKVLIQGLNGTRINQRGSVVVDNSSAVTNSLRIGSQYAGGLRAHMGPGNDSIEVEGIRFDGMSIIYGGTGNDDVSVSSVDVNNTAIVQTFDGDDDIQIDDVQIAGTFFAISLEGDDSLTYENSISRSNAIISTGNGNDFLRMANNQYQGALQMALTLDGDDTVEVENLSVGTGSLEIYTGIGNDRVTGELVEGSVGGRIVIAGQGGTDFGQVTRSGDFTNKVFIHGFEFNGDIVHENAREVDYGFATFEKANDSIFYADFVEFDRFQRVSSIEWLGSYENSTAPLSGDDFVIEIYESKIVEDDTIGQYQAPDGLPIATFEIGDDANRVDTGRDWSNFGPERSIFTYSADIDFTFNAQDQYWISIYSRASGNPGPDADNDFYILADDVSLTDPINGGAVVKWPEFREWYPNTSAKLHFTLRS
jgi:hypothetical protein